LVFTEVFSKYGSMDSLSSAPRKVIDTYCYINTKAQGIEYRMRCVVYVSGHYNLQYVVGTARIVCGAGSMKRYGVRTSVCTSRCTQQQTRCCRFAAVGCCGPGGQEISIDCCTAGAQPAAACGGRMRAVPLCPSTTGVARGCGG